MTGQEIFDNLPSVVQEKIKANTDQDLFNYSLCKRHTNNSFITVLFSWDQSPEGYDYWEKIANS